MINKFLIVLFCLFYSCDNNQYINTYKLPKTSTISINKSSIEDINKNTPFSWDVPKKWNESNKSSMRLASFSANYIGGLADISITSFSGQGGGVLANVNRWRKQLGLNSHSLNQINNSIILKKSDLGNYKLIKIINEDNPSSAFLCSIIEIKNSTVFVKMNASISGINQLEEEFITFCSSFK